MRECHICGAQIDESSSKHLNWHHLIEQRIAELEKTANKADRRTTRYP